MGKFDWMEQASCAQIGLGDLWFPEKGGSTKVAKEVCESCPVRRECLEDALERGDHFGVWGGTSDQQRRRIRRSSPDLPAAA